MTITVLTLSNAIAVECLNTFLEFVCILIMNWPLFRCQPLHHTCLAAWSWNTAVVSFIEWRTFSFYSLVWRLVSVLRVRLCLLLTSINTSLIAGLYNCQHASWSHEVLLRVLSVTLLEFSNITSCVSSCIWSRSAIWFTSCECRHVTPNNLCGVSQWDHSRKENQAMKAILEYSLKEGVKRLMKLNKHSVTGAASSVWLVISLLQSFTLWLTLTSLLCSSHFPRELPSCDAFRLLGWCSRCPD